MISHAQIGEDERLWEVLCEVDNGTYVDVGAGGPVTGSLTYLFYQKGWSGVCVEPVPEYELEHRALRPRDKYVRACAGDRDGKATFHLVNGTGLSTLEHDLADRYTKYQVDDICVDIRTLDDILTSLDVLLPIHFMSIDVEGAEAKVLKGLNLKMWKPWYLCIEATEPCHLDVETHAKWEGMLTKAGYRMDLFDGLNRFYSLPDKEPIK